MMKRIRRRAGGGGDPNENGGRRGSKSRVISIISPQNPTLRRSITHPSPLAAGAVAAAAAEAVAATTTTTTTRTKASDPSPSRSRSPSRSPTCRSPSSRRLLRGGERDEEEEGQPLLGTSIQTSSLIENITNNISTNRQRRRQQRFTSDLEAGCPTYESPKARVSAKGGVPGLTSMSDTDNDSGIPSPRRSSVMTTASTALLVRYQQFHIMRQRLYYECWQPIPTLFKTVLISYSGACWFTVWCIYQYCRSLEGAGLGVILSGLITTVVASVLVGSTCVATIVARNTYLELETILDQEGRSRAILNTLYPTRILNQMIDELEPDQIQQAQEEQMQERQEQLQLMADSSGASSYYSIMSGRSGNNQRAAYLDPSISPGGTDDSNSVNSGGRRRRRSPGRTYSSNSLSMSLSLHSSLRTSRRSRSPQRSFSGRNLARQGSRRSPKRTSSGTRLLMTRERGFKKQLSFEKSEETGEVTIKVVTAEGTRTRVVPSSTNSMLNWSAAPPPPTLTRALTGPARSSSPSPSIALKQLIAPAVAVPPPPPLPVPAASTPPPPPPQPPKPVPTTTTTTTTTTILPATTTTPPPRRDARNPTPSREKLGYKNTNTCNNTGGIDIVMKDRSNGATTEFITNTDSKDTMICIRRNSLNMRRASMTRRHSQDIPLNNNSHNNHSHSPQQAPVQSSGSFNSKIKNNKDTNTTSAQTTPAPTSSMQKIVRRISIGFGGGLSTPYSSGRTTTRSDSVGSAKSFSSGGSSHTHGSGRPIQERFTATTVLFADIAGFTHWCSEREPCHVFQLLESVFFAFDNLAKNLGVYKIETIGDCFAVTGIPKPMDGHAAAMALFASQIILEFDMVVDELAMESEEDGGLGADTAVLKLRVGCHSGPVTAGVLRGDKGRFQLFGDTVNTAARMESNGSPGKVQISEEMAQCLNEDGKSNWYHPRPDKISAKGKGLLNTYWLNDDLLGQLKLQEQKTTTQSTTPTTTTSTESTDSNLDLQTPRISNQEPPSSATAIATTSQSSASCSQQPVQPVSPPKKRQSINELIASGSSPDKNKKKADAPPSRPKRPSALNILSEEYNLGEESIKENTRRLSVEMGGPSMWLQLEQEMSAPQQELAEWNFQQLELLVKKIKARHTASQMDASAIDATNDWGNTSTMMDDCWGVEQPLHYEEFDGSILEELRVETDRNLIPTSSNITVNHERVVLPAPVVLELRTFVKTLEANFQKQNPFHSFDHACHMTRSMVQLLEYLENSNRYGILSKDPMAQFVIILTCMVQNVDNPGVTNEQLMKEDSEMAEYFHNTCLMQQNALDVAWELLVGPTCENLLRAICSHSAMELERFRKYMLHSILATDREDKVLAQERFNRWMKVANEAREATTAASIGRARGGKQPKKAKATWQQSISVIEQCMQMSNLIHTVQTPQIFAKWNEREFREQYLAYINGRRGDDPCESFYKEHLELMKRNVIPLAERFDQRTQHNNSMIGGCAELQRQAKINLEAWKASGLVKVKAMADGAKYEFGEKQVDGTIKHG